MFHTLSKTPFKIQNYECHIANEKNPHDPPHSLTSTQRFQLKDENLLDRVLRHRDAIISHLNWACIFLGFHSFGLYIHNDTMSALGCPQDMFSDTQ
jgi:hypothetical protein